MLKNFLDPVVTVRCFGTERPGGVFHSSALAARRPVPQNVKRMKHATHSVDSVFQPGGDRIDAAILDDRMEGFTV